MYVFKFENMELKKGFDEFKTLTILVNGPIKPVNDQIQNLGWWTKKIYVKTCLESKENTLNIKLSAVCRVFKMCIL